MGESRDLAYECRDISQGIIGHFDWVCQVGGVNRQNVFFIIDMNGVGVGGGVGGGCGVGCGGGAHNWG